MRREDLSVELRFGDYPDALRERQPRPVPNEHGHVVPRLNQRRRERVTHLTGGADQDDLHARRLEVIIAILHFPRAGCSAAPGGFWAASAQSAEVEARRSFVNLRLGAARAASLDVDR